MNTQLESPIGPHTMISGREYDYFSGTGYLGLQSHPAVIQAAKEALDLYGFSTVSSRGGLGEYALYTEFGHQAAGFFQSEKILHFASGY
ncbi:MAG: hypothetical protein LWX83_06290, partial [Anaerolineae bacterium]|nr:hypothetical protein [Anaerolineae bacterium]